MSVRELLGRRSRACHPQLCGTAREPGLAQIPLRKPGVQPEVACLPRGTKWCRLEQPGTRRFRRQRSQPLSRSLSMSRRGASPGRRLGKEPELLQPISDDGAEASNREWKPQQRCHTGRQDTGSQRDEASQGISQQSTRRDRMRQLLRE
ncbi:unannotated protein [freshwater metagenome]|uniref:Unannotated protein n=1 Tax=freshwater metagenome TaxID=449393 RepID=A0A6J6BBI0_9ZZZZ